MLKFYKSQNAEYWSNDGPYGWPVSPDDDTPAAFYLKDTTSWKGDPRPAGTRVWSAGNDVLHRVSGPAVEYPDGSCEYWVNGERFEKSKWEAHLELLGLKTGKELSLNLL